MDIFTFSDVAINYGFTLLFTLVSLAALLGALKCIFQKEFMGALNFLFLTLISMMMGYIYYIDFDLGNIDWFMI